MRFLLLTLFTILFFNCFSQNVKQLEDSLFSLYKDSTYQVLSREFRRTGIELKNQSKYPEALYMLNSALGIYSENFDSVGIAQCLNNLGVVYLHLNQKTESIKSYYQAIAINKKLNNKRDLLKNYGNLGNYYFYQNDLKQALKYYKICINLSEDLNDIYTIAKNRSGIGSIYIDENFENQNLDSALIEYKKALIIFNQIGDSINIGINTNNIGAIYERKNENLSALEYYLQAYEIRVKINNQKGVLVSLLNLGNIYRKLNDYKKSTEYYTLGKSLSKELKNSEYYLHFIVNLAELNILLNNEEEATHYFEEYKKLKDSLFSEQKTAQLIELQTKYQTEEKEEQINQQLKELRIKSHQNNLLLGFSITITIISLIAILFFIQRQKTLKLLRKRENEIHNQKVDKMNQDYEIAALNARIEGQMKERNRIAEDLHDRLGAKLSAIKLFLSNDFSENSKESIYKLINETIIETREIAHNLSSGILRNYGLVAALEDICKTINASNKINASFHYVNIKSKMKDKIGETLLYIVQELVANTLRHSKATIMSIQLGYYKNHGFNLIFEDNGIGFSEKDLKGSMGLNNIKVRLREFSGELIIDSIINQGSTFIITIPEDPKMQGEYEKENTHQNQPLEN